MSIPNLYDEIRTHLTYNRFTIGDLLFAEYTCPLEDETVGFWTHMDYLVHVISGKKTWHTLQGSWTLERGQTLLVKKGATVVEQDFAEDFCLIAIFLPDEFVKDLVREHLEELKPFAGSPTRHASAIRVDNEAILRAYFQSMLTYFSASNPPPEPLLKLKLQEIIVSLLVSESNAGLRAYFQSLLDQKRPSVPEVMDSNFRFNLSLADFARLSHRSLSSFKRDFQSHYGEAPGRWLHRRRLDYAAGLLRVSDLTVTQIVFESGFSGVSHFSRTFKRRFGMTPTTYRVQWKVAE